MSSAKYLRELCITLLLDIFQSLVNPKKIRLILVYAVVNVHYSVVSVQLKSKWKRNYNCRNTVTYVRPVCLFL